MRYQHILAYVMERPWAMLPSKLAAIQSFLAFKAEGGELTETEIEAAVGPARSTQPRNGGAVGVVPIYGILTQRGGTDARTSEPLTSTAHVGQVIQQMAAEPSVKAIVLDVDSPGGEVYGTAELGDLIARLVAEDAKPILAVANSMAASAAYWIGSQAQEFVVTPGGQVGSIGVYTFHDDVSALAEREGVKRTYVSAGKYKTEGNPFEQLGDEAREAMAQTVNDYYGLFVSAVARGRGVSPSAVRAGFGEGRMLTAKRALAEGMVDRIETLDGTLARLASGSYRRPRRAAALVEEEPAALVAETEVESNGSSKIGLRRRRLALSS